MCTDSIDICRSMFTQCRLICHEISIRVFFLLKAKTHLILKEYVISFEKIRVPFFLYIISV